MSQKQQTRERSFSLRTSQFLLYFQFAIISSTLIFLFAAYVFNIVFAIFDLLTIAIASFSIVTILFFADFLFLLRPRWLITNILGISFSIITLMPILLAFLFPSILRSELSPIVYSYCYFLIYGAWNLSVSREYRDRLEKEHPQVMILLHERGFFFMAYAYVTVVSFSLSQIISAETIMMKIFFLWMILPFVVMSWKPLTWYVSFQQYLKKTKEGLRLKDKAYRDNWKDELNGKKGMKAFWYLALPVGVLSVYFGFVAVYYFGLVKFNISNLLTGLLAASGGISILFYHLTRSGSLSRIAKLNRRTSESKPNMKDLKENLRDLENWSLALLGIVAGEVGLLSSRGIRIFGSYQGVQIDDLTLVYIDVFWLLIVLFLSHWELSSLKKGKNTNLERTSKLASYLSGSLWYFVAGLTGSFAYSLGIPGIVDAAVVVAFLLIVTAYRLRNYFWR